MALASVAASGVGNGVPVRQSEYSAYSTTHCRDYHAKCFRGGSAATATGDGAPGPVPPRGLLARLPGGAAAGEGCRGTEAWEASRVGIGGPVVQRALTAREVNRMTLLAMGRKKVRPSGGDVCTGGIHGGSGGSEGRRAKAAPAAAAASLTQMLAADPSGVRFVRGAPSNGATMNNKATGHILQPDDSAAAATKWVTEAQEAFQRRSGGGAGGAAAAAAAPPAAAGKGYQQSLARRRHDGAEASESGHWDTVYALGYRPAKRWAPGDCTRSIVPADQKGGSGRGSARNSAYSQSVSRLFEPSDTEPCLNPQILKGRGGGSGNALFNEGQQQCSIAHSHYVEQKLVYLFP
eukprot:Rhum_TRINITY_DN5329_c0_g1::Rhum_TRINITY_DN5329_c0_g1_i2::g.17129::m.17129